MGVADSKFKVYIANRPTISEYQNLQSVLPVKKGEIQAIGQACGNGWRKVFNVYAKLIFALKSEEYAPLFGESCWQDYRDNYLLQSESKNSLLFSEPDLTAYQSKSNIVHIVMGKGFANTLNLPKSLKWLDNEFAMDSENNLFVCPYFDYRQLSNIKIVRLVALIEQLISS